jgi:hypothetical protein
MKRFAVSIVFLGIACTLRSQTKIFKEVGEEISTQMRAISQDNALVGYLAFTRLEKASEDSFNYKITIMDENLNDIGAVNFREGNLVLQSVSFEANVLCVGYIQTSLTGKQTIRSYNGLQKAEDAASYSHILLQFINLDGKVINTYYKEAHMNVRLAPGAHRAPVVIGAELKYGMQIKNIPKHGFAFFYGDEYTQKLLVFDDRGVLRHEEESPILAERYYLLASGEDIYLLLKKDERVPEGSYTLYDYSARDLKRKNDFDLRDGYDNWLKVLSFDIDPASGDAYLAGCIINPKRENQFLTPTDYSFTPYLGLFTLDLGNPQKEMHANCSYWNNERMPGIAPDGMFSDKGFYVRYSTAFKDYRGNTIFAGTALTGKGYVGAAKYKLTDAAFVRQEPAGAVALDNNIPCDESKTFGAGDLLFQRDKKDYYSVSNPDTKTNYVIIDDEQNIYIYNVNGKKVVRTIPHKDGNVKINVFPAKEGHMMVSEYNKKEKYTRFSIEAL